MLDPDKRAGALSSIVEAQFSKTIGFTKLRGNYLLIYAWTQEELLGSIDPKLLESYFPTRTYPPT